MLCLCFWLCFLSCFIYVFRVKELSGKWKPQGSDTTQKNLSFLDIQTKCIPKPVSAISTHSLKHTVLHIKMKPVRDVFPNRTCESQVCKQRAIFLLVTKHTSHWIPQMLKCKAISMIVPFFRFPMFWVVHKAGAYRRNKEASPMPQNLMLMENTRESCDFGKERLEKLELQTRKR